MSELEIPLSGVNVNRVVQVGNKVRRTMSPFSPTIHDRLNHLERKGFQGCSRFLGQDAQGREILSFLPGEVGFMPYLWESDAPLLAAARLLRSYHDATAGYVPPPGASWTWEYPDARQHEVICHNDFAPYNWVCAEGVPYAIIDFDLAGPGPRLRDVAYAVYWLAPLTFGESEWSDLALADVQAGSRRLHLFCHTYGIEATTELLDMVEEVLQFLADWLVTQAAAGNQACRNMVEDGHLAAWRRALQDFQQHRPLVEGNIAGASRR